MSYELSLRLELSLQGKREERGISVLIGIMQYKLEISVKEEPSQPVVLVDQVDLSVLGFQLNYIPSFVLIAHDFITHDYLLEHTYIHG
jgi:hypothetical protein